MEVTFDRRRWWERRNDSRAPLTSLYQYKREPLSIEEADRLFGVAYTLQQKLCVYGLLETGLRVSEVAGLNKLGELDADREIGRRKRIA
jgi:hypothetical protein